MIGIPTVLITLDPEQSGMMRSPRAIHPEGFTFGHSLGEPFDKEMQTRVLKAALGHLLVKGEPGEIKTLSFAK